MGGTRDFVHQRVQPFHFLHERIDVVLLAGLPRRRGQPRTLGRMIDRPDDLCRDLLSNPVIEDYEVVKS